MNEETIFQEALSRSPEERPGFLELAFKGRPDLRAAVEARLALLSKRENSLEKESSNLGQSGDSGTDGPIIMAKENPPLPGVSTGNFNTDQSGATINYAVPAATTDGTTRGTIPHLPKVKNGNEIGMVIAGRYTLVEIIGEGGMGSVYLASQTEPVKRQVALKLIKTGMDSKAVLARFDAERQALALMDHPNIARIYDGGVTPLGQPFFVMELVNGVPLTDYCDSKRLTVDARLQLFVQVCQAVQHAHQKGIIHRDLKPGNILVTDVDGRPTPKVIDFGVAKATEQKLTDLSFADLGAIVGTPAYMSPEQADPSSMDIDTRTDVYALGVILFELLTGSPPINSKQFKRGAVLEMLRMVREVEPPRPSTALSTADALPNIAASRSIEPAKLSKLLQGELDWVVMKALEKDRTRRYETANGFARDIQRYLANEVVEARPPSFSYRAGKFLRRNKGPVLAAVIVVLALVGGIIGTSVGLVREAKAREAETQQRLAARSAEADAKAVLQFFEQKVLSAGRPAGQDGGLGKDVTLRKAIDAAEPSISAMFRDRPLVEASVRNTLGYTYECLGTYPEAIAQHERALALRRSALDPEDPDILVSVNRLGVIYQDAGRLPEAAPLLEETYQIRMNLLGPEHPDTMISLSNLARAYHGGGQTRRAIPLFEEVLRIRKSQLGNDHADTLISMNNLAAAYQAVGERAKALPLYEESLRVKKAKLSSNHPSVLVGMNNLARAYQDDGRLDLAVPLFEDTLKLRRSALGDDHPQTLTTMNNLARALQENNQLDEAIRLFTVTLELRRKKLGAEHPQVLHSMNYLARAHLDAGKAALAVPRLEETEANQARLSGPVHPDTLTTRKNLLLAYFANGQEDKARAILDTYVAQQKKRLASDWPGLAAARNELARDLLKFARPGEAQVIAKECVTHLEKSGPELWELFQARSLLGAALARQKQYAQAEPLLLGGYEGMKQHQSEVLEQTRTRLIETLSQLQNLYEGWGKPDQARNWKKELDKAKMSLQSPRP